MAKRYYIIYETKNLKNGKIYVGQHQTYNLDDGYLGSGTRLKRAIRYYGNEFFERKILYYCNSTEELCEKEAEIVTEDFLSRDDVYNLRLGGQSPSTGLVTVKDKDGKTFSVRKDDPRYLSGELVHNLKGTVTVKDKDGTNLRISKDDPRYLSGELIHIYKNKVTVKDKDGKTFSVRKDDPRYLSGELVPIRKGTITVKDKDCNFFQVDKDDPRYLSGELIFLQKNTKHSERTKDGMKGKKHQIGNGNSQYGTVWIYNIKTKENKKIRKYDDIPKNWIKGRKIK